VVNWLKQFTQTSLRGLMCRNRELRYEQIQKLALRRLTIDLDGTVIRTEGRVGDARLQPPLTPRLPVTTRGWPIWLRPGRSCGSRTARATFTTPRARSASCAN